MKTRRERGRCRQGNAELKVATTLGPQPSFPRRFLGHQYPPHNNTSVKLKKCIMAAKTSRYFTLAVTVYRWLKARASVNVGRPPLVLVIGIGLFSLAKGKGAHGRIFWPKRECFKRRLSSLVALYWMLGMQPTQPRIFHVFLFARASQLLLPPYQGGMTHPWRGRSTRMPSHRCAEPFALHSSIARVQSKVARAAAHLVQRLSVAPCPVRITRSHDYKTTKYPPHFLWVLSRLFGLVTFTFLFVPRVASLKSPQRFVDRSSLSLRCSSFLLGPGFILSTSAAQCVFTLSSPPLVLLPSSTYRPPSPPLVRRPGNLLNTIIEEESEEESGIRDYHDIQQQQQQQQQPPHQRSIAGDAHNGPKFRRTDMHIEAWLSPMSDHFPTPRGFHYLAAPILPSSPSTASTDGPPSPMQSLNPWNNRASVMTDVTEFDDLHGVSDDEDSLGRIPSRKSSYKRKSATGAATPADHARGNLPQLVIPNTRNGPTDEWSATSARSIGLKTKLTSPVPPTPPTRVEMSPQVFSFMQARQAQEVPTMSAPPSLDGSLDGSLSSEQMAQMSAPPTPVIGNDDDIQEEGWSGVRLQPGALATLQALSGGSDSDSMGGQDNEHEGPEQVLEVPSEPIPEMRQQPLRIFTGFHFQAHSTAEFTPTSQRRSLADLTRLEIPSPGGFFSGLSPRTRSTWHMPSKSPDDMAPPTSTTAEQFYRCPWNADVSIPPVPRVPSALPLMTRPAANDMAEQFYRAVAAASSSPVEQVVEVKDDDDDDIEDDMPTARPAPMPSTAGASGSFAIAAEPVSPETEEAPIEIVTVYDPDYARKQQEAALSNLDRTEMWLMAQRSYLKPIETEDEEGSHQGLPAIPEDSEEEEEDEQESKTSGTEPEIPTLPRKKTVRFSSVITITRAPCRLPSKFLGRQESTYYRAFQDYIIRKGCLDVFVHRLPRFEALQAQRISLPEYHRNQLMGKYQLSVVPQSAKKRLSANVARGDDVILDDPEKLRQEKEQEAMSQITMSTWHVAANKMLNGGHLISAPVAKRLARVSRMAPGKNGVARDRARILDLGGQSTCDWAWHCALQFPNTKIYTVTTKAIRQLSNSNIRGPPNHRQVAVERLTRLPFADDQFDLVSARELHSILKFVGENGEDEWESCLRECMRVLKPGGYLEFSLLDSDIMNAGPLGLAKSVEFGFTLKTLGYDPCPTKMWLGRLSRAGFDEIRRAWMYLPMGERRPTSFPASTSGPAKPLPALPTGDPSTPQDETPRTVTLEAMVTGSSDAAASITGIAASWIWERWLLRCEMEKVAGELRLGDIVTTGSAMTEAGKCLDGVAAIVEEGRMCGAGWRMLNGYARKPRLGMRNRGGRELGGSAPDPPTSSLLFFILSMGTHISQWSPAAVSCPESADLEGFTVCSFSHMAQSSGDKMTAAGQQPGPADAMPTLKCAWHFTALSFSLMGPLFIHSRLTARHVGWLGVGKRLSWSLQESPFENVRPNKACSLRSNGKV
ncbi:hypothetical protein ACRALDRAFT_2019883 [Sodiomyces alcalophilus JCM 7366]|uniref:uncharacterized protein n=1 Tax=Sodiomyces alcalophilus JCM 7366 TaxID=591952 RepID=UPI0039B4D18E